MKKYASLVFLLLLAGCSNPLVVDEQLQVNEVLESEVAESIDITLPADSPPEIYWCCNPFEKESEFLTRAELEYPAEARGVKGKVVVMVLIDKDGTPLETRILKGDPVFHNAATKMIMASTYTPTIYHNHEAIKVWMMIPVKFSPK
ncbi:MAG: TonB family protein [Rhizobacter sp.]|nr:TonB family protein [Chlorobiales bacterium]